MTKGFRRRPGWVRGVISCKDISPKVGLEQPDVVGSDVVLYTQASRLAVTNNEKLGTVGAGQEQTEERHSSVGDKAKRKSRFTHLAFPFPQLLVFLPYCIINHGSKWHSSSVFEFRPRRHLRPTKGKKWSQSIIAHSRPHAGFFARSIRCRNGFGMDPTSGFSAAIGTSHARFTLHCAVCCMSIMSRSTSIPT